MYNTQPTTSTSICLHGLISRLMDSLLPLYVQRGNLVLNDISHDTMISGDEDTLAFVMGSMMKSAVMSTRNECIHIDSIQSNNHIIICIKGISNYFYQAISHKYREVQHMAALMGGTISLDNDAINGAHVSFSISNQQLAA
jgi:hypothetical protein